jgi:DNA repair protein RadD
LYSAGLGQAECVQPIIFGGIQSAVNKPHLFGYRDFLFIDEAHLLNDDGSYIKFILALMAANPFLKVVGFTATRYRQGLGCLTNGKIFSHIIYDICNLSGFNRLVAEGYLSPLIPRPTKTELDVSGVSVNKGEYAAGELQAAVDKQEVTYKALEELVEHSNGRRSWLVFASGTDHADHIGEMLSSAFGVSTTVLHSKRPKAENETGLKAWKAGEVTAAVSMGMLTTGVNNPQCDLIGMLRPTASTGLWVQMLGRGTRCVYAPGYDLSNREQRFRAIEEGGKQNCMVLDFARNLPRLGPINDPIIPRLKNKGPPGDAPVRICEECGTYNHASARYCLACGFEFKFAPKIMSKAGTGELVRSDLPQVETFDVRQVVLVEHFSYPKNRDPKIPKHQIEKVSNGLKVCYYCGLRTFYEYINFEAENKYVLHKAHDWFRQRFPYSLNPNIAPDAIPEKNSQVLAVMSQLIPPKSIRVWVNQQFPKILSCEF